MPFANSVEEQYFHYSYPEPNEDIQAWLKTYNYDLYSPSIYSALFWPEGRPRTALNILIAGCGTMQAAILAHQNPECNVTGIDFSSTSIAHEEGLRSKYNLTNLTLKKMDLRDASQLGTTYDLIVCSGVLHHLPDPGAGLRSLASVLEPVHGAMLMMLYARLGRTGVYALQDAFRRMRIPQSAEGVNLVRETVRKLPPRHPARMYFDSATEMKSDAAVVDTFLHSQDTAYSVQDVLNFVEGNSLKFQGWLDNGIYNRDWGIDTAGLAERDVWSISEDISATMTRHDFIVSSHDRDARSDVSFEDDRWLNYYPRRNPNLRLSELTEGKCVRGIHEFAISPFENNLANKADGTCRILETLKHRDFVKFPKEQRVALAKDFYARMWRFGHMHFSIASTESRKMPVRT